MRVLIAMIKKEIRQIIADKFYLRFLLIAPVLQLVVLGFSLTMDTTNVPTVIYDADKSVLSRELIRAVELSERFTIVDYPDDYDVMFEEIQNWRAAIAVYIPPDFGHDISRGNRGDIMALLDSVDGNKALTAFGYLQQLCSKKGITLAMERVASASRMQGANLSVPIAVPLEIEHHYLFNRELKNEAFMVPGIVVMILTIITLLIGSMSLVREKEAGTLEQLSVTPIKRWQIILGKVSPFLLYAFIETTVVLKIAEIVFQLYFAGSIFSLYVGILIYLFSTIGLGLFVSTMADTQQQALFISWFFMIFMILLSGFFIPIENMPHWLQYITRVNPLRYMLTIVRELYLKGTPIRLLFNQMVPLFGIGITILGISIFNFHKTVE